MWVAPGGGQSRKGPEYLRELRGGRGKGRALILPQPQAASPPFTEAQLSAGQPLGVGRSLSEPV